MCADRGYLAGTRFEGIPHVTIKERIMPIPEIDTDECSGCGICVDTCAAGVLEIAGDTAAVSNEDACVACGDCMEECPMGAIEVDED